MPALALYDPPLALSNSTTKHEVNVFRVQGDEVTRERLCPGAASTTNLDIPVASKGLKDLIRNHIQVFVGKDLKFLLWQDGENRLQCSKPPLQKLNEDITKEIRSNFGKDTKGLLFEGIAQYAFLRSTPLAKHARNVLVGRHESVWDEHWADSCWAYRVGNGVTTEVAIESMESSHQMTEQGDEKMMKTKALLNIFRKQGKQLASNYVPKCWKAVVAGAKLLGSGKLASGKWSDRDGQKLWIFEDRLGYSYIVKSKDGPSWQGNTFYSETDFSDSDIRTKKARPSSAPASHGNSCNACPASSVRKTVKLMDLEKNQPQAAKDAMSTYESRGPTPIPKKCYHSAGDYAERLHKVAGVWIVIQDAKLRDSNDRTSDLLQETDSEWYCTCALRRGRSVELGEIKVLPTRFDIDAERHGFRHGDAITFSIKKQSSGDVICNGTFEYDLFFPRGFHGPFELHGKDGNIVTLSLIIEMKWSSRDIDLCRENLARPKRDNAREVEEMQNYQEKLEKNKRIEEKQARWKFAESKDVGVKSHTSKAFPPKGSTGGNPSPKTKKPDEIEPTPKTIKRNYDKQRLHDLAIPKQREFPPSREHNPDDCELARFQAACAARGANADGDFVPWGEEYVPDLHQLALPKQQKFDTQESQPQLLLDEERLNDLARPKCPPSHLHDYLKKSMIAEALMDGTRVEHEDEDVDQTRNRRRESILNALRFEYEDDKIAEQGWSYLEDDQWDATQTYIDPLLAHSQSWLNECSPSADISRAYSERFGSAALRWAQLA